MKIMIVGLSISILSLNAMEYQKPHSLTKKPSLIQVLTRKIKSKELGDFDIRVQKKTSKKKQKETESFNLVNHKEGVFKESIRLTQTDEITPRYFDELLLDRY